MARFQGIIPYLVTPLDAEGAPQREAVTVRGYGDLALMHGRVTIEVDVDGAPRTLRNCFINAWAHRNGVWQMVHWQSTPIPQSAK